MVASRFEASSSVRLATPGTVSWMLMSLASSQGGVLGKRVMGFLLVRFVGSCWVSFFARDLQLCRDVLGGTLLVNAIFFG